MSKLDKALLGLAGEYAVAYEICRRGFHAQITFGRWKNTDILAVNVKNGKTVLIEVKSKQGREWPGVKGIVGRSRLQIFVDFEGKGLYERPDFYIVDEGFWRDFTEKIRNKLKTIIVEEGRIIHVWPDNYKGTSLKAEDLMEYKEKWNILVRCLE